MKPSPFALLTIAMLAAVTALHAQDIAPPSTPDSPSHKGPHQKERIERMKQHLGLSDEQAEALQEIMKAYKGEFKTVLEDPTLSQEDKKAQMQQLQTMLKEELSLVLDSEQMEKAKEMFQKMKERRANRPPRNTDDMPPEQPQDF